MGESLAPGFMHWNHCCSKEVLDVCNPCKFFGEEVAQAFIALTNKKQNMTAYTALSSQDGAPQAPGSSQARCNPGHSSSSFVMNRNPMGGRGLFAVRNRGASRLQDSAFVTEQSSRISKQLAKVTAPQTHPHPHPAPHLPYARVPGAPVPGALALAPGLLAPMPTHALGACEDDEMGEAAASASHSIVPVSTPASGTGHGRSVGRQQNPKGIAQRTASCAQARSAQVRKATCMLHNALLSPKDVGPGVCGSQG